MTADDLLRTIQNFFVDQETRVSKLKYVFNFRDWFKDYIRTLSHHTEPHSYKYELNHAGVAEILYGFRMDRILKSILS